MKFAACWTYAQNCGVQLGGQLGPVEAFAEVHEPAVARLRRHGERRVPHAQPRVPALVGVRRGAAPVLLEEHREPVCGGSEVLLGVERPQHLVGGHALVERVDDELDRVVPADRVVERLGRWLGHGRSGSSARSSVRKVVGMRMPAWSKRP